MSTLDRERPLLIKKEIRPDDPASNRILIRVPVDRDFTLKRILLRVLPRPWEHVVIASDAFLRLHTLQQDETEIPLWALLHNPRVEILEGRVAALESIFFEGNAEPKRQPVDVLGKTWVMNGGVHLHGEVRGFPTDIQGSVLTFLFIGSQTDSELSDYGQRR